MRWHELDQDLFVLLLINTKKSMLIGFFLVFFGFHPIFRYNIDFALYLY